ncbi:ChrR family anti-sigma-E factor [Idiomarina aquatica]|jgi:putative transcriptional regulator|uniref:Transcriptional regulator n=1 Tax=Idiomarina aquatica TaxID=1327752 RepID=A0AA94EFW5_9GAMM|nr:ChrR family anti-sigma-E factor [Idiomarina aquatica]RUO43443.1 transcriptional regulator [Idiomarina aquatica]
MIKSHPSEAILYQYAAGDLSASMTLVVGTHIDMCPVCQQTVCDIESDLCQKHLDTVVETLTTPTAAFSGMSKATCDKMLEEIFSSEAKPSIQPEELICLEGRRFVLPRTLACNHSRIGEWTNLVGKLWRAPVNVGERGHTNLIYMEPGTQVPEHTHKGQEATLVIDGVFNDENDVYYDGDFILLDADRTHTPQTSENDCLTLATLDAPLYFTSGISRLLNPFSSLFFRV